MTRQIALSLLTLCLYASNASALDIGDEAPMRDHAMRNVRGANVSIQSVHAQRGVVVIFTCNHCPWSRAWESRITEIGNRYRERGFGVIAINSNDPAEHADDGFPQMQERARALGMRFPYVVDETSGVARAYGATRTPEVFVFDQRWRLVYHGAVDDNAHEPNAVAHHYLRDVLEAMLAGRPIAQPETRSMGCTIKFRD